MLTGAKTSVNIQDYIMIMWTRLTYNVYMENIQWQTSQH